MSTQWKCAVGVHV